MHAITNYSMGLVVNASLIRNTKARSDKKHIWVWNCT